MIMMKYIELKTGYNDDGPAWIGRIKASHSGKTLYFNDHAFQRYNQEYSNYIDIETGDAYWISGVKKHESNRHWAGKGTIMIDRRLVKDYLELTGLPALPEHMFTVVDIADVFPIARVHALLNAKD